MATPSEYGMVNKICTYMLARKMLETAAKV